jgi:hypothetical protein
MVRITSLSVKNASGTYVPNTYFRQESETKHLTLILPGLNYTCDMPLLYYSAQVMLSAKADVVQVKYDYTGISSGRSASTLTEKYKAMREDLSMISRLAMEHRSYQQLTVIGKSLGTLGIPYLFQAGLALQPTTCIFLTPILKELIPWADLIRKSPKTLFAIGTNDPYYDTGLISEFRTFHPDNFLIVEGVNHSMEFEAKPIQSMKVLNTVIDRIQRFIIGDYTRPVKKSSEN